jgi:hypothetical protein
VTNTGAANATNLTVTDVIPASLVFQSATGAGWTCNQAAGTVTCTRASLAPGAAPPITITVTTTSTGVVVNVAALTAANIAGGATVTGSVSSQVILAVAVPMLSPYALMVLAMSLAGFAVWWLSRSV